MELLKAPSELLVGKLNSSRNLLPPHLSEVRIGGSVSNHFCDFWKPTIKRSLFTFSKSWNFSLARCFNPWHNCFCQISCKQLLQVEWSGSTKIVLNVLSYSPRLLYTHKHIRIVKTHTSAQRQHQFFRHEGHKGQENTGSISRAPPLLCSSAGHTFTIDRKHLSR